MYYPDSYVLQDQGSAGSPSRTAQLQHLHQVELRSTESHGNLTLEQR